MDHFIIMFGIITKNPTLVHKEQNHYDHTRNTKIERSTGKGTYLA
jgi:hypothetical protein